VAYENSPRELFLQQRVETGLPEMVIGRESVTDPQLAHRYEGHAVGEGPLFVTVAAEPIHSGVKTTRINPFQLERFAAFNCIEKIRRGRVTMSQKQESSRFIDNVFRCDESPPLSDELLLKTQSQPVILISCIP
jgi:hypothetical protein